MKQFRLIFFLLTLAVASVAVPRIFAVPQGAKSNNGTVTIGTGTVKYSVTTNVTTSERKEIVADESAEFIESYVTDSAVNTDGTVTFTETIRYRFPEPRHGIFRTIPYVKTNADGKKYAMRIRDFSATDEGGNRYKYSTSDDGENVTYKIGDPDKTIEGTHVYVLSYTVSGALTYFPGHDELYWNAVGTRWNIPVLETTATVELPGDVAKDDAHMECFTGSQGSTEKSCTATYANNAVTVKATRPLGAYEGMTFVVGFPKGLVAVLEPEEVVPFFETLYGQALLIVLTVAAFLWYVVAPILVIRRWFVSGRDPKPAMGEVAAWFSPPRTKYKRDLTPPETGTLVDERADLRDIYAGIVDLARRGYIRIKETKKETFRLEKVKEWADDTALLPYEKVLLEGMIGRKESVDVSDLEIPDVIKRINGMLYDSLVSDGFFPNNPQSLRNRYYALAGFAFMTVNPVLFLVSLLFGSAMPKKTLFGAEQAAVARSLRNFLTSQDKKLAFQAKNQMMFERLLPYAIAFGVEEIWAKRFKDIALENPDWYVSSSGGRFNSVAFAHSVGSGFSASFAASVSYKSSSGFSSGFSGGGGSSGGGGGGGGGGSW